MSAPNPALYIPTVELRHAAIKHLGLHGIYWSSGGMDADEWHATQDRAYPYLAMYDAYAKVFVFRTEDTIRKGLALGSITLVNSPRHYVAYLRAKGMLKS